MRHTTRQHPLLALVSSRHMHHSPSSPPRIAVSCGLHQLSSIDLRPQSPGSRAPPLLPPPTDYLSLGERIHAFWAIHGLDRTLVAVSGLPSAFGDDGSAHVDGCERITTLWPRPLGDYQSPVRMVMVSSVQGLNSSKFYRNDLFKWAIRACPNTSPTFRIME